MKKKLGGTKIGTIFSILLCLIAAVVFWFFVEYTEINTSESNDSPFSEESC